MERLVVRRSNKRWRRSAALAAGALVLVIAAAVAPGFLRDASDGTVASAERRRAIEPIDWAVGASSFEPPQFAVRVPASAGGLGVDSDAADAGNSDDPRGLVWELVAELEALAVSTATFHASALPVIERLAEACRASSGAESSSAIERSVWSELLEDVAFDEQRSELVRGAVALAIAPGLSESEFWRLFDSWLATPRDGSLELVRAVALTAAMRGEPSACERSISLRKLAQLPSRDDEDAPRLYPLVLERVGPPDAGARLRRWIDAPDARLKWFAIGAAVPDDEASRRAALDYFATAELLWCVWAHQAVQDARVERELVRAALVESEAPAPAELLVLRATHFVMHTLSECRAPLRDAIDTARASANPLVRSLTATMDGLHLGGFGIDALERIERLRYSGEPVDVNRRTLLLLEAGEALRSIPAEAAAQREQAIEYLRSLAEDAALDEIARNLALSAVFEGATWPETQRVARAVLIEGRDPLRNGMAIEALTQHASAGGARAREAIALLKTLVELARDEGARTMIARALEGLGA